MAIIQASNILKIWNSTLSDDSNNVEKLIKTMQDNQIDGSCNSFITKLQQLSQQRQELPNQGSSKLLNYL